MDAQQAENKPLKKKSAFYIDGYNWYHSIFRHHPEWKWLDLQSFFEKLRPHEEVCAVKLFSAMNLDRETRRRQETYFNALRTLPKVEIILGVFQQREVSCRSDCGKRYTVPEEKKTDVNLSVALMADAFAETYDHFYIISGDSDVQPPVEWIAKNKPHIKLMVYVPALSREQGHRRTDYYKTQGLKVDCAFLPLTELVNHQLKHVVSIGGGKFSCRPESWV